MTTIHPIVFPADKPTLSPSVQQQQSFTSRTAAHRRARAAGLGTAAVEPLEHYSERANAGFTGRMIGGYLHGAPLAYLSAFLRDSLQDELRDIVDFLIIKGRWAAAQPSQQLSDAFSELLRIYKCIYLESKKIGLTHWYAVMAKGLYILLKRLGILCEPIGPEIYYHGMRTPYLASNSEMNMRCPG